jgi:hypothetical protein
MTPKNLTSNIHILFGFDGNRLWINECIATKKDQKTSLPPNVGSNKYSEKRNTN